MPKMYERGGLRKRRTSGSRRMELGYYVIVTDAEKTEKHYFEGLRDSFPSNMRDKIHIEVLKEKTSRLVDTAIALRGKAVQYSEVWIVFDRDQVPGFDEIIERAIRKGIKVGWSNPCFEVWLLALLGKFGGSFHTSAKCVEEFKRVLVQKAGQAYCDDYKAWPDIYRRLDKMGDVQKAIEQSRARHASKQVDCQNPSQMDATTTVYELVHGIEAVKKSD